MDRVSFGWTPELALAHNLRRLDRSLRKRRERFGEAVTDEEIAALARAAAERPVIPAAPHSPMILMITRLRRCPSHSP